MGELAFLRISQHIYSLIENLEASKSVLDLVHKRRSTNFVAPKL